MPRNVKQLAVVPFALLAAALSLDASPANRLCYLDGASPFHVDADFPKLTTPMWIGEEGVESAIILSIDDLNQDRMTHYRDYLEPILKRLEEIQGKGKASLSIFTNTVNADEPQLARWFERGVRLDVHTRSHPCPLLKGPLDGAVAQVLDCLQNLELTDGPGAVCFRMPCCDSINSASPRFFSEIAARRTEDGAFLRADSSVMMFPEESYAAYAPFPNYAATATGYPYPFVVGRFLWEFPIISPTDWQAQHRRGVQHADTVADIKAGIDSVFEARGLYTFCFHPHGWIRNDQVVEIVDHAVTKYGRRVRFLQFHEALERLVRNLLAGVPLRGEQGEDNGVRLLDVNDDGFLDVVIGNDERRLCRIWEPKTSKWKETEFPFRLVTRGGDGEVLSTGLRFGVHDERGHASALVISRDDVGFATFDGDVWKRRQLSIAELLASGRPVVTSWLGRDRGVRLRDVDGDGYSDLLVNNEWQNEILRWDPDNRRFVALSFALPSSSSIVDARGRDRGLRFIDADGDGNEDIILSNDDEYWLYLYQDVERGWGRRVVHGPAAGPALRLPTAIPSPSICPATFWWRQPLAA